MAGCSYHWTLLQQGTLPLRPSGLSYATVAHACSAALVWPEGQAPSPHNTVLTDPCFTEAGRREAEAQLRHLGASFADVGHIFVTHPHLDHLPMLPHSQDLASLPLFRPGACPALARLAAVGCPGHDPVLTCLVFPSGEDEVWIVGDAVLDREWLEAWAYYVPNGYTSGEVVETWRSLARILCRADVVVPGHGPPIRVTAPLVEQLAATFPRAPYADQCPDVRDVLLERLARF